MSHFNTNIDEVTLKAALKGRQGAYRHIYDCFKTPVYDLAYRMLQHREDALDVMQNSFVSAFNSIKQWSGQVAFGFWLRRIVINQCLQLIKQNNKHRAISVDEIQEVNTEGRLQADSEHDLNVFLSQLPPLSRSVLWLFEVEGLSHQEIANMYQMSVSFSKSQLSRSKKLMAEWLANEEQKSGQQQKQ